MNANEVIANRALGTLGLPRGSYDVIHPLDHVNHDQSTNDVYPTAVRLELLVQPPCADLLARADDCPRDVRRQQAEIAVGLRCRLLDRGQRAIRSGNWAMVEPVIAKFSTARTVCTP